MAERLLLCLLLWLSASVARAADIRTKDAAGIRVTTIYAWPSQLNEGYWPLLVEVSNIGTVDRDVRLKLDSWYGTTVEVGQRLSLAAGESTTLELLFPAFSSFTPTAELSVFVQNVKAASIAPLGPDDMSATATTSSLIVSGADGLSPAAYEVQRNLNAYCIECSAEVMPVHLPSDYGAYTSIDTVVLDGILPEGEAAAALWAWVRLGGRVAYIGDASALWESQALASWMMSRFDQHERDLQRTWRMGFGVLSVVSPSAKRLEPASLWERDALSTPESNSDPPPEILGFDDLGLVPVKAFSLLMFGVACLLGPLNFLLVRVLKRPQLLLVTTPLLATGSTLVLVAYASFQQGLSVKQGGFAEVLLDQRSHRMASRETRGFFAGLVPGNGLQPGLGTHFIPYNSGYEFRYVEWRGEGRKLSGDLLPARKVSVQAVLTEGADRRRVEVSRSGDALVVSNGLGAPIQALVVWDGQGEAFMLDSDALIPAGGTATLPAAVPLGASAQSAHGPIREAFSGTLTWHLAENSYLALLPGMPLSDLSGLTVEQVQTMTAVWGILDEEL